MHFQKIKDAESEPDDPDKAVKAATARWRGGDRQWGEGTGEAYRLALRGRDPFADPGLLRQFADISYTVFAAVQHGALHTCFDDGRHFTVDADEEAEA